MRTIRRSTNIVSGPELSRLAARREGVRVRRASGSTLNFNFSGDGQAERVPGLRVSASTFTMLGVAPELGRTFRPEEDQPGHDVAIISRRAVAAPLSAAAPTSSAARARINARPFEIIGVMPATFRFPNSDDGRLDADRLQPRTTSHASSHSFQAAARLRAGVTLAAAKAELDTLGRALAKQYPDDNEGETRHAVRR